MIARGLLWEAINRIRVVTSVLPGNSDPAMTSPYNLGQTSHHCHNCSFRNTKVWRTQKLTKMCQNFSRIKPLGQTYKSLLVPFPLLQSIDSIYDLSEFNRVWKIPMKDIISARGRPKRMANAASWSILSIFFSIFLTRALSQSTDYMLIGISWMT